MNRSNETPVKLLWALLALLPCQTVQADAADAGKGPLGYGSKDYEWGRLLPEQLEVIKLGSDAARGKEAFRGCRGCHRDDGAGVRDGTYPRLTGQHASVIVKQVVEVRAGVRMNPKMKPFSSDHAVTPQEIADIAAYLTGLTTVRESGKGDGDFVARGKSIYEKDGCIKCHGKDGEGNPDRFYPVIAAQHFGYLRREMTHIQKGERGNSHPRVVEAIKHFTPADIDDVADYLSRLPDFREAAKRGGVK